MTKYILPRKTETKTEWERWGGERERGREGGRGREREREGEREREREREREGERERERERERLLTEQNKLFWKLNLKSISSQKYKFIGITSSGTKHLYKYKH